MLSLDRQNAYRERYRALRPGWRPSGEVYEAAVRRYLTPRVRLLDLGCGRGGLSEKLSGEGHLVFGIDPDFQSLVVHRAPVVHRAAATAERLPYASQSFDLITASWLLEHLSDPGAALREVRRVLVPGGRFVFITPNAIHPLLLANRMSRWLPTMQQKLIPRLYNRAEADTFPVHYRANTARRLPRLGRRAGLELTRLDFIPDPTYLAFGDLLFWLAALAERLTPRGLRIHLVGVYEKVRSETAVSSI